MWCIHYIGKLTPWSLVLLFNFIDRLSVAQLSILGPVCFHPHTPLSVTLQSSDTHLHKVTVSLPWQLNWVPRDNWDEGKGKSLIFGNTHPMTLCVGVSALLEDNLRCSEVKQTSEGNCTLTVGEYPSAPINYWHLITFLFFGPTDSYVCLPLLLLCSHRSYKSSEGYVVNQFAVNVFISRFFIIFCVLEISLLLALSWKSSVSLGVVDK